MLEHLPRSWCCQREDVAQFKRLLVYRDSLLVSCGNFKNQCVLWSGKRRDPETREKFHESLTFNKIFSKLFCSQKKIIVFLITKKKKWKNGKLWKMENRKRNLLIQESKKLETARNTVGILEKWIIAELEKRLI